MGEAVRDKIVLPITLRPVIVPSSVTAEVEELVDAVRDVDPTALPERGLGQAVLVALAIAEIMTRPGDAKRVLVPARFGDCATQLSTQVCIRLYHRWSLHCLARQPKYRNTRTHHAERL